MFRDHLRENVVNVPILPLWRRSGKDHSGIKASSSKHPATPDAAAEKAGEKAGDKAGEKTAERAGERAGEKPPTPNGVGGISNNLGGVSGQSPRGAGGARTILKVLCAP